MADTRPCIELAIPPRLFLAVANGKTFSCFDSVGNITDVGAYEELLQVRVDLAFAIDEALSPLNAAQNRSAVRWLDRVSDAALFELDNQPAAKAMRAISWWLAGVLDDGLVDLWQGSQADRAITKLMRWNDNTFDLLRHRACEAIDASAQKQARRLGEAMNAMGYFLAG
ncbi:hypothetical protein KL86PLE_100288 [uncultured Pleomorphomonas sp.]|uniref:Uncharacterized protein n=1 Tax=uncultured Pleomorphomonas sp. TaxID=442121 RepID=A0A212L255_9HYPH|nr:hypothetical protein [uncultured Pleomorphomonas sp.]SCM71620.1 hypothetical protein KL86PLE_100288 [uncultured Pleomorphomonas sp.]